ncbi:MAG: secretin and TonB N-terminal domain-containing protein [candidate division WOR-3 bacterium]
MYKRISLLILLLPFIILGNPEGEPELTDIEVGYVDGMTEVTFILTDYANCSDFTMDNKIVIDLLQTKDAIEGNLWNINRGGIESIALSYIASASLTRIVIERSGNFSYEISNPSINTISLKLNSESGSFQPWSVSGKTETKQEKMAGKPSYQGDTQKRISMRLENADLVTTLRSIAQASGMNIIIGDEVRGVITVELDNIAWEEAMDLVLKTKGYTYVIENGVIRVGKPETFAKEQENIEMSKPIKRKVFVLEFTTPQEISSPIKSLLSKRGIIETDIRTNSIIVSDIALKLKDVESLVKALDKKTLQVAITSKIVDIDRTAARELGLSWQVTGLRNETFNVDGDVQHVTPAGPATGAFVNVATVQDWGSLTARLMAMEQDQRLDITSNPRVTTVNNKEATIFGGKRFAITTLDINGQPITRWYQAGIELNVTPHINSAGDITMEIGVEMSDVVPGSDNTVITETRSETETLVKNGQTLVIGGFYTKTITEQKTGIPLLKDIPLLGLLFGHTAREERKREVLIFITPHIVETELGGNI